MNQTTSPLAYSPSFSSAQALQQRLAGSAPPLQPSPRLDVMQADTLRATLKQYFLQTFDCYESLFSCLNGDEAFYHKPIALRHPLIFYYGHTATFFINKLLLSKLIEQRINPHFESIFAVGVDEMSWDDLDDSHYDWPTPAQVKHYRDQVRATVLEIIEQAPLSTPIDWQHSWWSILMGIEHERIHLETSSVLIRQHALDYVQTQPPWRPNILTNTAPENALLPVAAGRVQLGKERHDPVYGWDNEYGQYQAEVAAFAASRYLVSNQEFLAFVEDAGYQNANYWEDEGWQWRSFAQAKYPTFWRKHGPDWSLRLLTEEVPMPWDWPAEVNYHEAKAFCHWKAKQTGQPVRLPTEEEWYRLVQLAGVNEPSAPANLALAYGASSCPVNTFPHGDFYDLRGNVWQWTETPIYPFPGFVVHPIYDDFSTPTFDGQHNLLKGGSWISAGNEAELASRYAFRRHFFQHAGFRYVVSDQEPLAIQSQYETDRLVSEYLEFQYGREYFGVANFAQTLVQLALTQLADRPRRKALDIGCATGRASFELARYFDEVVGIDFSARFIQNGVKLAQGETLHYSICTEGELVDYHACDLAQLGLAEVRDKVQFYQGDACNLKAIFRGYDFILAANLIDRLHHPAQFLSQIHTRLNMGGILMLSSPYTWMEEHTVRSEWLGGFKKDGENWSSLDGLTALLEPHFRLMTEPQDIPFVIRETQRKFQHTYAQVSFWERIA